MTASRHRASFGKLLRGSHARGLHDVGEWEPWFAWRPVWLHGEIRIGWLRPVSRRFVLAGVKHLHTEYSDLPGAFPRGAGLKKR